MKGSRPSEVHSARKASNYPKDNKPPSASASEGRRESTKQPTSIDARIIATLRQLNLTRRADPKKKGRATHFERIVLQFALVRDAFTTIRSIYKQYANAEKDGLDFEGLKSALSAMGAQIKESDMSELFYESDMVRDNSLTQNEFVVSLAIAHLLGLITNFDSIKNSLVHAPEDVTLITPPDEQPADQVNASKLIAKALDLMVTAYLLFDNDASGTIQTNEVLEQMRQNATGGASSPRRLERVASGFSSKAIQDERIKELDFDQDGTITFQEFVLTFQRWAGSDDDDE
ncbi:calcium-binding protein CML22 [Phytophthora cinnamomi]|uniref:calcium-binding protein CML22 n=1 Tax=Phytophthora cinnamomi TaxID=4785 RepID=UPI002A3516E2|nr:calcium-binding protein CML22 [Phytophthora cinnamomi]KAJ8574514.1 hypothetical protein ON010_g4699 [Phytophthora cinnamomi]